MQTSYNDVDTYYEKTMMLSHSSVLECERTKLFIQSTMFNQSLWLDYWTFSFLFSHKIVRSALKL